MIKKFICTKSTAVAIKFTPGKEYSGFMVEPDLFRVKDDLNHVHLMPLSGNLVTFSEVKK